MRAPDHFFSAPFWCLRLASAAHIFGRSDNASPFVRAEDEEVFVPRDNEICARAQRTFKEHIVVRISANLDSPTKSCPDSASQYCFQSNFSAIPLPQELFGQDAHYLGFNFRTSRDYFLAHGLFERPCRGSAAFGKLKGGNPHVRIQDDNHPCALARRRDGLPLRICLRRRGTSASL